jgi:hypothetical protein
VRPHLAREHLLDAEVVDQGGEAASLSVEGDHAEGRAILAVTPDELAAEVLRLRGAPTVTRGEQTPAVLEGLDQLRRPAIDALILLKECGERIAKSSDVLAHQQSRPCDHETISSSAPASGTSRSGAVRDLPIVQ